MENLLIFVCNNEYMLDGVVQWALEFGLQILEVNLEELKVIIRR